MTDIRKMFQVVKWHFVEFLIDIQHIIAWLIFNVGTLVRPDMYKMKRQPTHPGKIIKEDYLLPLSISIKDMASNLGVSRKTLSKILNEKGTITPDMALRLSRAFETTPNLWMNLQKNYELWQAEHSSSSWQTVKPLPHSLLHSH